MKILGSVLLAIMHLACSASPAANDSAPDAAPFKRIETLSIGTDGLSEELTFEIPPGARALTVLVRGDAEALFALASLRLADAELVGIALDGSHMMAMQEQYYDEQVGQMTGALFQSIRLGTFTHVYPHAPGQTLQPGQGSLRVASTLRDSDVEIELVFRKSEPANVLHLNVLAVSEQADDPLSMDFVDEVNRLFEPVELTVVIDEIHVIRGSELARITDFSEPQESPGSQSAQLALFGQTLVSNQSLNVFLVDALPFGVGGLSLGTPGPPDSTSYYYGVLARFGADATELGRVVAHEVAHFLALQHVDNQSISGQNYPDPIEDTQPGTGNLMEGGTSLTPGQQFALHQSVLLSAE